MTIRRVSAPMDARRTLILEMEAAVRELRLVESYACTFDHVEGGVWMVVDDDEHTVCPRCHAVLCCPELTGLPVRKP